MVGDSVRPVALEVRTLKWNTGISRLETVTQRMLQGGIEEQPPARFDGEYIGAECCYNG